MDELCRVSRSILRFGWSYLGLLIRAITHNFFLMVKMSRRITASCACSDSIRCRMVSLPFDILRVSETRTVKTKAIYQDGLFFTTTMTINVEAHRYGGRIDSARRITFDSSTKLSSHIRVCNGRIASITNTFTQCFIYTPRL